MELLSTPLLQGQPSNQDIVSLCLSANTPKGFKYTCPHHGWTIWIQHGPHITISTARTQLYAQHHADPKLMHVPRIYHAFEHEGVGYILMEYIPHAVTLVEYMQSSSRPGEAYALIADTVRHMTRFTVPKNAAPGPVGGGSLRYGGFPIGWERQWKDVSELQECVNEVLQQEKTTSNNNQTKVSSSQPWRVDFTNPFSSTSLMFCYTDLCPDNFLISTDEASSGKTRLHIIDFHQAGFLPRAFLELVLCQVVCAMPIYPMVFPEGAAAAERRNLKGLQRAVHLLKMRDADARKPKGRGVRISRFCRRRWHPLSLIVAQEYKYGM